MSAAALISSTTPSLDARAPVTVGRASPGSSVASFSDELRSVLAPELAPPHADLPTSLHAIDPGPRPELRQEEARVAAEQIVSTALVQPLLSIVRETSWAEGPFAPNSAEKRFGPMLDQQLADRLVQKANFAVVDRLQDHLLGASVNRSTPPPELGSKVR